MRTRPPVVRLTVRPSDLIHAVVLTTLLAGFVAALGYALFAAGIALVAGILGLALYAWLTVAGALALGAADDAEDVRVIHATSATGPSDWLPCVSCGTRRPSAELSAGCLCKAGCPVDREAA